MDDHDDLLQRLRTLGAQPVDPARQSADLTAMAMVRPRPRMGAKVRLAGAFLAGLLIGSTGLAAADALPDPAQHIAHTALGHVGVGVPDPDRYHGAECGSVVKKNHGAYVRDDHSLAQTKCGKKLHAQGAAGDTGTNGKGGDKGNKGPCHGKPSWAGDKTLTAEERAAAQAARVAQCGSDAEGADTPDAAEPNDATRKTQQQDTSESSSTTLESSTTTEAPTTTVTTGPTTTSTP